MPQSSLDMTNGQPNDPSGNQSSHQKSEVAISQQPLHSVRLLLSSWVCSRGTIFSRWAILQRSGVKLWKCNCIIIPSTKRGVKVRKANKKKQQLLVWERTFVPSGLRASLLRLPRAVSGWRRKAFIPWRRAQNVWLRDTSKALLYTGVTFPGSVCHRPDRTQYSQGKETTIFWKHPTHFRI